MDGLMGKRRIRINEMERAVMLRNGRVERILGPGEHAFFDWRDSLEFERHDLARIVVGTRYENAIFEKLPQEASRNFEVFTTGSNEVAIIERDRRIAQVMRPDKRLVLWKDAGPYTATKIDVSNTLVVPHEIRRRLIEAGQGQILVAQVVQEGHCALVYIDGALDGRIEAGAHAWWNIGRNVATRDIDLRKSSVDVTGQEVLTRDRVTIRVNISAEYKVADPLKAAGATVNYADALYRALQFAFRKTLGALSLDQILEKKVSVDEEAAAKVRSDMAEIGLEVSDISLKDVILPGEMREILNQVVAAEKQAEANVIRRREETNATRSLLNTAKVMAENPVMLRLKELEALEAIAGKVERLTINNGTAGLLNDLVKLRD